MSRALMFQGTGSDVGKSVLVAGLCRAYKRRGLCVVPFKPQNMSNNAAVTACGGEIGRAQWLQAVAAGVDPTVDMNPVLLKPETDTGAQIILHGKKVGRAGAETYRQQKPRLLSAVIESFEKLKSEADLVLVEGAGSPAEVNLRAGDIANMGFALPTQTPVVLIGDINKGGVIAAICGTHRLLPVEECDLIKGTIINLFRGDVSLFDDGLARIFDETAWPNFGVVPFLSCVKDLPAEDAVVLEKGTSSARQHFTVAVPMLPRISNFDDLDPLKADANIDVVFCPPGTPLPADSDLIVIPGSKATIADLLFLKQQGWDIDIKAHVRRGRAVLGICGGLQMLGKRISDPGGVEGAAPEAEGLGLLEMDTRLEPEKQVCQTTVYIPGLDCSTEGYEIHCGVSNFGETLETFMLKGESRLGVKARGLPVYGTYLHGLFEQGTFRQRFMEKLGAKSDAADYREKVETALNQLADALEEHLDLDALLDAAG